ncbi:MAG: sigma-54 interaction domain-containing protein [Myxococcota bacterium]
MKTPYTCESPFERGGGLCKVCRLLPESPQGRKCARLVARSEAMRTLLQRAATVANTDASVVMRGESGSGKEVVARALHANSPRRLKPFLAVNCAALPGELLESELFGHAKGAFTGAQAARKGLFEAADGGTLFLDEIAEMPLPLQAKLLRALQDGEIRRVGESQPVHVDVRIVCATHQNLQQCVREKRFREDLYFRLKVFTLVVPPVRERGEDIPVLANMFLDQEGHTGGFTPRALQAMQKYPWPGNVRELQNAVKHGAVLSMGKTVDLEHLPEELAMPTLAAPFSPVAEGELVTLEEAERRHVLRVLEACHGQQVDAARVLGIGRTTLWRKLKGYGLDA